MVYLVFFIVLILIFPLIFTAYAYFDYKNKRLFIALYLFSKIKLISGYINVREKGGVYFHLSDKKVIIINKEIFDKFKGKPNFLPKITVFDVYSVIDSGVKSQYWLSFLFAFYTIIININCICSNEIKYITLKTDLNVVNLNENLKSLKVKVSFSFNVVGIFCKFFDSLFIKGNIFNVQKQ